LQWHSSQQDSSARTIRREKKRIRAEIEALMWRYTRALDTSDGTTYAATYTTDGQFKAGATATSGREALKKMVDGLRATGEQTRPPLYHMEANSWIEFVDKDHARHHAYYLTVSGAGAQNEPPRIACCRPQCRPPRARERQVVDQAARRRTAELRTTNETCGRSRSAHQTSRDVILTEM
jgi:hypothetical protein